MISTSVNGVLQLFRWIVISCVCVCVCVGLPCATERAEISFTSFLWWLQSLILLHSVLYCSSRQMSSWKPIIANGSFLSPTPVPLQFTCLLTTHQCDNLPEPVCVPCPYTYSSELPYSRCVCVCVREKKRERTEKQWGGNAFATVCL